MVTGVWMILRNLFLFICLMMPLRLCEKMKTKFLKTLLETLDIIIMEYGEHMEEASRGLEETRFAYVDNCVKALRE